MPFARNAALTRRPGRVALQAVPGRKVERVQYEALCSREEEVVVAAGEGERGAGTAP